MKETPLGKADPSVKQIHWLMAKFTNVKDKTVVRKIPYKLVYRNLIPKKTKIIVFDTKKFKMEGSRVFKGEDPIDPFSFFAVIQIQGYKEGWFDPRRINVSVEPTTKLFVMENYADFNTWLKA